jgi:hypothetical protein
MEGADLDRVMLPFWFALGLGLAAIASLFVLASVPIWLPAWALLRSAPARRPSAPRAP